MKIKISLLLGAVLSLLFLCTCGKDGDDTKEPSLIGVTGIQLSQTSLTLEVGEQATLTATVSPSNATDKTVKWSSSQTLVATVFNNGQVTAVGNGTAVITATAGSKRAQCTVTVEEGVVAVESITLSEESLTIGIGETVNLSATVMPENATDRTVTWTSSDEDVAIVSEDGAVSAIQEGTATIIASAGGKSAQCMVTVEKNVVAVTEVILSQTSLTLEEGASATLSATVHPDNATDKQVTWTSSNSAVATVSASGVVTAVKEGTATITASAGGKSAQCAVTVKKGIVEVTGITLSQTSLTLEEGESVTLIPTVTPENATDNTVTWESSNASVVSVSLTGVVTGVAEGTAIVTATAGSKKAQCTVTVKKEVVAVTEVILSQTSLSLEEGASTTLSATVHPDNATDKQVTWTSSNNAVATVSASGVVAAVKEGTAIITASAGGKSAQCTVTVKKAVVDVTGITLSQTTLSLEKGETATLTATVTPSDATDKTVSWKSSDTSVATVSSSGIVTAIKAGKAIITATAGSKTAQCVVTVKAEGGMDAGIDPWEDGDEDYGGTVN